MPQTRKKTALVPLRTLVILAFALLPGLAAGVLAYLPFPPGSVLALPVALGSAVGAWVAAASGLDHIVE